MSRILALPMAALFAVAPVAKTEQPAADVPAAKLAFYVGHWNESGQSRADPASPFTPMAGFETCEWHAGGQAVICRETTKEAAGTSHSIYIMAWEPVGRRYVVHGVDNHGGVIDGTGELDGDRWTWMATFNMEGASAPLRFVFVPGMPGTRDMTIETPGGKDGWSTMSTVHYAALE